MKADKIYKGGFIYTAAKGALTVEAVAIAGNRIIFAGNLSDAEDLCDENTEICDLEGKMMLPGFIDGHCHIVGSANYMSGIYFDIEWSLEECLEEIKRYIAENPDKENIFGLGYAEWLFDETGPKKEMLDEVCPDKPILLMSSSGHEGWTNTLTLEKCGISRDTPDPVPGLHFFRRDEKGNPTGHLVEAKSVGKVLTSIDFVDEDIVQQIAFIHSEEYAAMGVTAVADMGTFNGFEVPYLNLLGSLQETKKYRQRFLGCGCFVDDPDDVDLRIKQVTEGKKLFDNDRFRIGFLKILNDGTMETRTAAISEPYLEDGQVIEPLLDDMAAAEAGLKAAAAGLDINMHAIGDLAIHAGLKMAKAVREAGYDEDKCRITISHSQYIADRDIEKFAEYGVLANTTGVWIYDNPEMDPIIGHINWESFRLRSVIDSGAKVVFGSDFPVDEYGREPLKSIQMAVTRRMYDDPNAVTCPPEYEGITVKEAIDGFTIHNAYQMHMENKIGSIEAGKYADFVILEKNIMTVPADEIWKVKICETIMDGVTTYKAAGSLNIGQCF
ncbi:MAG: amidohydrolase [Clostridia bacterium]|nr:amidohydrolase [Clostridia bacterium]